MTERPLLLCADGIFDPLARTLRTPGFVEVAGSSIRYAGTVRPRGASQMTSRELQGYYLLPGLIESHAHLCFDPGAHDCVALLQAQSDQVLLAAMAARARNAARNGVTTVRDLGDRNYLTTRLAAAGDARFPTILTAGPPITSPGGHCFYLGGEVATLREAVNAVAEHSARGVDVIKIMITGGILTRSSDPARIQFDMGTVRAVVDTAHSRGRTVAAHAHTREGIELALLCGADTIEHATFATEGTFSYDSQLAEAVADSECWVCPTYVARPGVEWQSKHFSWRGSVLARLHHAGVRLAGGTDAGVKQGLDHASVGWVVSSYVAAGIPVMDALIAVTYGAAQACRVGNKKGVLAAGWDADLIVVRSNPLANPFTITEPALVMNRGHILVDHTGERATDGR